MIRDAQIDALKKKLFQIEKNIEEENGRAKLNRMQARYFMLFFLIGGEEESCSVLERKVKELLYNPDACKFLQITETDGSINYGEEADHILKNAAANHEDVQNLNSVFLCPVIFAGDCLGSGLLSILHDIDKSMNHAGRVPTWQPTIVINKNVSEYKNIYQSISIIKQFITEMPEGRVNRCCLLSDTDENGFVVPKENIMQTIAMMVVLQNVITQNSGDSHTIRHKVKWSSTSEDGKHLFFTARNAAVTNPIRSVLLQRMISAIDFFAEETDSTSTMSKIRYSFVNQIMGPYLNSLPHHGGFITLFPLYSVMADGALHSKLERIIKEKYFEPLCGKEARAVQLKKATSTFLEYYFAENGSLSSLKRMINENGFERDFLQHKMECYSPIQIETPNFGKKSTQFQEGDYEQARMYCENLIKNCSWDLLESVGKLLSQGDMLTSINEVQECIEQIKFCIKTRLRQLKDVETVLVVDQTEGRTQFGDIQYDWLKTWALNNAQEYSALNKKYDRMIFSLLQKETDDYSEMFDICYDTIKNSTYSNNEYLDRVDAECMTNEERAREFSSVIEKSWCYTLRFLRHDETKDSTCIIGDAGNCLCRTLKEKFRGTLFDFKNFDRIDVLHISGAFSPEDILEWEQIESLGKERNN